MSDFSATLFGKFNIQRASLNLKGLESRRVQELLSYLLVFRAHPQSRELLCEILWSDQSSANSRKYLRQTLWRLQSAFKMVGDSRELELRINDDWIQIKVSGDLLLDVADFEKVFDFVKGKKAGELSTRDFKSLEYAAD